MLAILDPQAEFYGLELGVILAGSIMGECVLV